MPHNKPTVDRLPEPRYTLRPDTVRQMRTLAKRECANCFDDGKLCVVLDAPCFQAKSNYLECSYFKECVLPLDEILNAQTNPKTHGMKSCAMCGGLIFAANNRQKYCNECREKRRRAKKAEREREYRAKKKREQIQKQQNLLVG